MVHCVDSSRSRETVMDVLSGFSHVWPETPGRRGHRGHDVPWRLPGTCGHAASQSDAQDVGKSIRCAEVAIRGTRGLQQTKSAAQRRQSQSQPVAALWDTGAMCYQAGHHALPLDSDRAMLLLGPLGLFGGTAPCVTERRNCLTP